MRLFIFFCECYSNNDAVAMTVKANSSATWSLVSIYGALCVSLVNHKCSASSRRRHKIQLSSQQKRIMRVCQNCIADGWPCTGRRPSSATFSCIYVCARGSRRRRRVSTLCVKTCVIAATALLRIERDVRN